MTSFALMRHTNKRDDLPDSPLGVVLKGALAGLVGLAALGRRS